MSDEPSSGGLKIKGIPDQGLWALAAIFLALALPLIYALWISPPPRPAPEEWWVAYALLGIILMPTVGVALFSAFFCLWVRLIADDDGLRWRYFGRWHRAGWAEITDYYIQPHPQAKTKRIVATPANSVNLNLFPKAADQLAHAVQERAQHAKTREWGLLGTRPCDEWPQTFTYDLREFRQFPFILAFMTLAMPFSLWLKADFAPPAEIAATIQGWLPFIGWPVLILAGLTFVALFSVYPLLALISLPRVRIARARQEQKIICDLQGIALQGCEPPLKVAWPDVTRYYTTYFKGWIDIPGLYVVETTQGRFDFSGIERQPLLIAIIQRYATQASTTQWQNLADKTDGVRHNPTSALFPVVHTYRTNINRAMCWLPTGFALAILLSLWLNPDSNLPRDNIFVPAICGFVAFCMWLLYYNTTLTRTETGLSTSFFGRQASLGWNEIEKLDYRNGFFMVSGRGRSLRFSRYIGGVHELVDEIIRRAPGHIETTQFYDGLKPAHSRKY